MPRESVLHLEPEGNESPRCLLIFRRYATEIGSLIIASATNSDFRKSIDINATLLNSHALHGCLNKRKELSQPSVAGLGKQVGSPSFEDAPVLHKHHLIR